jgi:two-component system, OmpR family, copper resistance phosphate regulon response regulator CusR
MTVTLWRFHGRWEVIVHNILCIEDDAETRILLRKSLEAAGMRVETVWSGDKGVEAALNGNFDCIVLDLMMPGMNGFQAIQALKSQGKTGGLPVVVLTARDDDESRRRAMLAGADDYLLKPFDIDSLVKSIHAAINAESTDSAS